MAVIGNKAMRSPNERNIKAMDSDSRRYKEKT
jgi:hypothetical protein